jgi:hypothetical protein
MLLIVSGGHLGRDEFQPEEESSLFFDEIEEGAEAGISGVLGFYFPRAPR